MNPCLRDELVAILTEELDRQPKVLELTPTGEVLSRESMDLARFHERGTVAQRAAIAALLESWLAPVAEVDSDGG